MDWRCEFCRVQDLSHQVRVKKITVTLKNEPAGIKEVNNGTVNENAPIYNLAGQRVGKDYKGVVIQNGKKFYQEVSKFIELSDKLLS